MQPSVVTIKKFFKKSLLNFLLNMVHNFFSIWFMLMHWLYCISLLYQYLFYLNCNCIYIYFTFNIIICILIYKTTIILTLCSKRYICSFEYKSQFQNMLLNAMYIFYCKCVVTSCRSLFIFLALVLQVLCIQFIYLYSRQRRSISSKVWTNKRRKKTQLPEEGCRDSCEGVHWEWQNQHIWVNSGRVSPVQGRTQPNWPSRPSKFSL